MIGGGIAGLQASLDLAEQGIEVYLVEKNPSIGGKMIQLDKTFPTMDCSACILTPKMVDVSKHSKIHLLTYSDVERIDGEVGAFKVKIHRRPRYVDETTCTGCGLCTTRCPVEVPNEFDDGLGVRKAIYVPFPQAVPLVYTIDMDNCILCSVCEKTCAAHSIKFDQKPEDVEIEVGAIIVATGYRLFDTNKRPEYGHGKYDNVITGLTLERILSVRPDGRPYCSTVGRQSTQEDSLPSVRWFEGSEYREFILLASLLYVCLKAGALAEGTCPRR